MNQNFLGILLVIAILAGSAILTQIFARWMYLVCPKCRTLNARRRVQCRQCGHPLRPEKPAENPN